MRVSAVRLRGQTFYGAVTSTCAVVSRSGGKAELIAVSTPESLHGADPAHLDRVIVGTIPLVDAVPYRGGGLDVEIGLFAIPGAYLTGPYLDLLGDIATMASAFLTPAGALASAALMAPVRKGLDQLLGAATGAHLETGLAHTWQEPAVGSYAVVRAPEPVGGFRVGAGNRLMNPDGSEVRAPYIFLRLDAQRERHNWADIPDVSAEGTSRMRKRPSPPSGVSQYSVRTCSPPMANGFTTRSRSRSGRHSPQPAPVAAYHIPASRTLQTSSSTKDPDLPSTPLCT
jgi:hypothetical protein